MKKLDKKQSAIIIVVLVVTAILAALIFFKAGAKAPGGAEEAGEHSEAEPAHGAAGAVGEKGTALEPKKGPHNGKLFEKDGYGLEIAIFEQDVEPEFRIYTYKSGKPLDPSASQVAVKLERLGRPPQTFKFVKEKDYLKGDAVVFEPHSFKVSMTSRYAGQAYQFAYDQVEARVNMSAKQAKESGIDIQTAGPMKIDSTLQLIGEIRVNEDRTVHIVPRLAGLVESVSVNAGDQVRKGQVMAVISSQSLAEQRSELLAAQRRVELARSVYQREKKLWEEKISAEQDYLQARSALQEAEIVAQSARQKLNALGASVSAGGNLTRYEIRSPINGTVAEKKIAIGETLKEDAKIFIVSDLSSVWADLTVQAKDLGAVKVGQKATVKATAFEHVANGTLSYIGALVGEQTRSANARVVLANPDGKWRPGLPVSVELVSGAIEAKVAVSTEAIQTMNYGPTVFGRYGENFEARPLELGRSDGKFTEVVQGLAAGEQYAAKNSFLLKADLGKSGASHDH
jgi:cobalt-zinc-cadmium efflux system membrane fusion protein